MRMKSTESINPDDGLVGHFFNDRQPFIHGYIEDWDEEDSSIANKVAQQITTSKKLPDTVVIIPVAAHSEARNIIRTLSQYAKQIDNKDFAVHLHLNWPNNDQAREDATHSFVAVSEAKELFPGLDIRTSYAEYENPTIGAIRKAAWDGTLLTAARQGTEGQTIGLNHDIDLMALSRRYITNMQKYYQSEESGSRWRLMPAPAQSQTKHYGSPDHPNTSMAVFFQDFLARQYGSGFEAGLAIPMSTYAGNEGFSKNAATYETHRLLGYYEQPEIIPGTSLQTSIRRHLDRLPTNDFETVWTDDTFGPDDECRIRVDFQDITREDMLVRVGQSALNFGFNFTPSLIDLGLNIRQKMILSSSRPERHVIEDEIIVAAKRAEKMVTHVLDRVVGAPRISGILSSHYFAEDHIRYQLFLKSLYYRNEGLTHVSDR